MLLNSSLRLSGVFITKYDERTNNDREIKDAIQNNFKNLCYKSIDNRQREDDLAPYRNTGPSTSRDPDSEEWRKG